MARILPWKRREQKAFERPDAARSDPAHQGAKKDENRRVPVEADPGPDSDSGPGARKDLKRSRRSISTSPVQEPPQEDYMIEGADGDDRYRMVEDEFLATAHQYTAHLHAAEYKRLKAAAEVENAQAIKNISRPVVGRVTDLVRLKKEKKALAEKQRLATRKFRAGDASGDESAEDDDGNGSWQQQSLYGLMESPGKRARRLDGVPLINSVTRAAAGYNRQTTDVTVPSRENPKVSSNTDDHHTTRRIPQPIPTSARTVEPKARSVKTPQVDRLSKATETPQGKNSKMAEKGIQEDEDLDFIERLKRRQEERRRSRGQRKSTSSTMRSDLDDILPGFL